MSFFPPGGGAGGGWPPPPPFFSQPPPGIPMQFFQDPSQNQGFPPGMQTDFQQQGYNPYAQMPVPIHGQSPSLAPVQAQVHQEIPTSTMSSTATPHIDNLERGQRASEYKPSSSQYSASSQDHRRRSHRDDGEDDDPRYARRKRSPVDEQLYRRRDSDERGRQKERGRPSRPPESPPASTPQGKRKVDIDALLQDERLRNVLFAGISKATAKLEQSLQDGKERPDFEPQEAKNQLFPSASTSQKPRSILKRKDDKDSGGSKALSNLSALERTLHMLRGKGDVATESTQPDSRLSAERKSPPSHGALGKLSAYDEGNNEDSYRYKSEKHAKETDSSASSSSKPFWSVPSKLEASKRESDSFDVKEKMFEEWRQSIGKQSGASSKTDQREREMNRGVESREYKQSFKKKEAPAEERQADNQEELDSTVQNILQSIGFNFDLSKRMQELARKKRMQEDEGSGIRNVSASFMDKGDFLAEELKASLIRSGSDLSSIDTLIKEVRASSQSGRLSNRAGRSPSPDRQGSGHGREVSPGTLRYDRSPREERFGRPSKDTRAIYTIKGTEQWERVSPQSSPPRRHFREEVTLSPRDSYGDQARKSGQNISERFRDDGGRNEYFYPEKDYTESPPSVPLLTSLSSRKRNEDLTGGLLKSLRVENFRVMSRSSHDDPDDETYREMRRVILPAKSDRDKSLSPPRTVMRKRSASPIAMRISKERKISPGYYDDYSRRRSPSSSYQGGLPPNVKESPRRQSPPSMRREKSKSPQRRRSRSRTRSRSPYRRKSPARRRSRSPRRRSRSPRRRSRSPRRRSRSPRRRSRSPHRGSSRSPVRRRKSPVRRLSPLRKGRKTPPRKIGRSRSRSTTRKYRLTATDGKIKPVELTKRDLSKLPEKERKAELKKIVMALGNTGDTPDKVKASEEEEKKAGRVATIMADLTSLSQLDPMTVNKLTAEVLLLSAEQQSKTLGNVTTRRSKVLALKAYLERLVKVQNELMRKCQRNGLGNKDPQLKANNLSQMETEKEIDRLSAPALAISLTPDYDQTIKDIQAKLEKETANLKGKEKNQNKSKQSNTDKKASVEEIIEPSEKTNWTSVTVEEADLPVIAKEETKDGTEKKNQKQKSLTTKSKKDVYYEYIDSKNHWCSHCHLHLNALDQFYCHLHGKKHFTVINDVPKPWENEVKKVKSKRKVGKAQTRRVKGSEMLFPIAGFYCTLCAMYCGDFKAADQHLKSDGHYDRYLEFIRDTPGYEKKLLLEKTGRGKRDSYPIEKKTTPLPTPETKVKKSKSLRQKKVEEEKEAMNQDDMEPVDMELDEKDNDVDVARKVAKASRKLKNSVAANLSSLPESGTNSTGVEMKSNKEDEVKSLDKFLTIETSTEEPAKKKKANGKGKKSAKIPVIDAKEEVDLLSIPIPEPPKLTTIPLPPTTSTVKTLKEVEDEEKIMMGIDIDADEEKQLAPLKRPPPLSHTVSQSESSAEKAEEKKDIPKPKRLDTLFSKVSKSSSSIIAQKAKSHSVVADEESEFEKKIQQDILEKLEKEKQKLIKRQEKKERLEKKLEEKKLVKKKKKVISDSSSEEDSDSEEEKTPTVKIETEDFVDVNLPKTNSESIEIANSAQNLTSASGEEIELESVKEEMIQSQETIEEPVDGAPKVEIKGEIENNAECETNSEDVTNSSVSMDIGSEVTSCGGDKTEQKSENVAQDSSHGEVSVTMQLLGLDQHTNMEIDGNNAFSMETTDKDAQQVTRLCDDSMGQMESIEEIPSLDASSKQLIDTGIVSEDVSIENLKKTTEDSSHEELPSPESNEEPKLSASINDLDNVEKESVEEDVSLKPKTVGHKELPKTALQSESDLLGVLGSSPEALAKGLVKSQGPKRSIAKKGGKAGSRASKKIPQSSAGEQGDANISMDDLVALSEVTDDVPKSKEGCEISNASVEKANSESLVMSNSENDKAEEIEKQVEAVPIKSVSAVQRGRGGKTSARGKSRGRRVAVKKESDSSEMPLTTSSCAEETNRERSVESEGSLEPEAANTVDSVEAKQNAVEEVAEPVVNRNRRGRSATVKTTPAKTGRQTRTRGKKKEVEPGASVSKEENINLDVGETAGDAGKEEEEEEDKDSYKSNNMPGLQMESESTDEAVIKTVDQTEPTARPTRSRQCKNVAVVVTDGAVQNIAMQAMGEEKNKDVNEDAPGSEKPKSRALRSRQAKNAVDMGEQKTEEDGNDSDATITEDVDGADCTSLAAPIEEYISQQAEDETTPLNPTSNLSPTDPQPQRDPPMSGVVTDDTMETSDPVAMTSGIEEMPMTIDPSEVDNLPTAGLDLDEEDDSMEFPDSMAGFTVLDVEGQPDDDCDSDTDDDL